MKTINKIITLCFGIALLISCNQYTDGINEDPNNFQNAPAELLIGQGNLAVIKLSESQSSRVAGIWVDHFTGSDRQYELLQIYGTTASDYDDDWDDIYTNGLAQAKLAEDGAVEIENPILEGVAQIQQAILLGEAAALWGDVPNTEALDNVTYPNPNYDNQLEVLSYVQNLLTKAISNLGGVKVSDFYNNGYVLNEATWKEVAHSLKARYYMIVKNYPMALLEAKMGVSSPEASLMAFHSDAEGSKNLYYQFQVELRGGYITAAGPSHLYNLLNGTTARLLDTPGDSKRLAFYFNGTNINTTEEGYFAVDASFPVVSWIETKLIEAEAEQRVNMGTAGEPAFTEVRNYLATAYGGVFPTSTSSGDQLLNEILEEKYVSLPGSLQVFHDARRTKNVLGIPIKKPNETLLPQRFLYPQTEINSNDNFPGLIDLFTPTEVNK